MNRDDSRKCNKCGEWKYMKEFPKDRSRDRGRGYACSECRGSAERERYKKRCDAKRTKKQHSHHMMTDEAFHLYYKNKTLRDYIQQQAIRYSKHDREKQKDLMQVGWARIAMCQSGKDDDFYKKVAHRAMYGEYKREYMMKEYGIGYMETLTMEEYLMWQMGVLK